jgi:GNAT superfamily N-acetyltransferase
MAPERGIEIGIEGHEVVANCGQERVGRILLLDFSLQWCKGTFVPLTGVADVGTDRQFRRRGIARLMMQEAVDHAKVQGHVCSGVSTGTTNVARRLYSGAGYVYLFAMQGYEREPRRRRCGIPAALQIRGYESGDEQALAQLRSRTRSDFFGCLRADPDAWVQKRREMLESDPESTLVALQDGQCVGYASYFQHWFGLACDICVAEVRQRLQVGRALLSRLEVRLEARGCERAVFSATQDEGFVRRLLEGEGYRRGVDRVFQVNILDLGGLLSHLGVALEARISASAMPEWTGALRIMGGELDGAVAIGPDPGRSALTVGGSREALTGVLCGRLPGWEAYLRGDLDVHTDMDARTPLLLQTLFPRIPCCHPIDEWW